jgi:hypothetical protein
VLSKGCAQAGELNVEVAVVGGHFISDGRVDVDQAEVAAREADLECLEPRRCKACVHGLCVHCNRTVHKDTKTRTLIAVVVAFLDEVAM